jgi:hypothetical protein
MGPTWKTMKSVLLLEVLILIPFASGTTLCEGCRPLELLNGPGIPHII